MLGNEELLAWFQRVRLPEPGRSVIRQVRSSDPARRVGGGDRNPARRWESQSSLKATVSSWPGFTSWSTIPMCLSTGTSLPHTGWSTRAHREDGW